MTVFFKRTETMVLSGTAHEARSKLLKHVKPPDPDLVADKRPKKEFRFYGVVGKQTFRISRAIRAPQNFLPQIAGVISPTSKGCIVFLTYSLFFSTRMFLVFWMAICLLIAIFFALAYKEYVYAAAAFFFGLFNYLVAFANFRVHVNKSRQELLKVFGSGEAEAEKGD